MSRRVPVESGLAGYIFDKHPASLPKKTRPRLEFAWEHDRPRSLRAEK
jgi:hypothetical protein